MVTGLLLYLLILVSNLRGFSNNQGAKIVANQYILGRAFCRLSPRRSHPYQADQIRGEVCFLYVQENPSVLGELLRHLVHRPNFLQLLYRESPPRLIDQTATLFLVSSEKSILAQTYLNNGLGPLSGRHHSKLPTLFP